MMSDLPATPFVTTARGAPGLSRHQLDSLVATGVLRPVLRGVHVRSDVADTTELRASCLRLVLPRHVVVSDRSAAWLHGVDCFDPADLDLPPDLEVVSVDDHGRTRRRGVLGGERDLEPDEICEVCGILTTTALRTACDLACLRGRSAALAVLDAFSRLHGLTRDDYRRMLPRFTGRRGVRQLRELVNHATPLAESPGESWTRMAVIDAGLPAPQPNAWVEVDGYGRVRLDLSYPRLRIAVEYDGVEFHTSPAAREHDARRRAALRRQGWIVIVVTRGDFTDDRLAEWTGELRDALRERRPAARRRYSTAG